MMQFRKTQNRIARTLTGLLAVVVCAGTVTAAAPETTNHIHSVDVRQRGEATVITVKGSERPMYTAFKLSTPHRLVLDVANSRIKGVPALLEQNTSVLGGIAVSEMTTGKVPVSRVMINFRQEASYRVRVSGNDLIVTLRGAPTESAQDDAEEQVISLANAQEQMARVQKEADERVSRAMTSEKEAQSRWRSANADLNKLKAQQEMHERGLQNARKELEDARAELDRLQKAKTAAENRKPGPSVPDPATVRQIQALNRKVQEATETAHRETEARSRLEASLAQLQTELAEMRETASKARTAQQESESAVHQIRETMKNAHAEMASAKTDAAAARIAQRRMQDAYSRATEAEKAKLQKELDQLSRETVASRQRYVDAEQRHAELDQRLKEVLRELTATQREARRAQQELVEAENRATQQQAQFKGRMARLQNEVRQAEAAAAQALREKEQAEQRAARVGEQTQKETEIARQRSEQAIADANRRLALAEKTAREARSDSEDVIKRIQEMETRLEDANRTILSQKDQIGALQKQAEQQTVATPDRQTDNRTEPMTQEDLRMARLAEMQGRTTGSPSSRSAAPRSAAPRTAAPRNTDATGRATPAEAIPEVTENAIQDIRFVNRDGLQKVVISGDGDLKGVLKNRNGNVIRMELSDVRLLPMLERTLDVRDFGGVIQKISSYREGDSVLVEVHLQSASDNRVAKVDGNIEWSFTSAAGAPPPPFTPMGNNTRVVHRENDGAYRIPAERTAAYSVTLQELTQKNRRYTGRRIDLDFKNADIHNILRLLADVGQVNIVTAQNVSGTVTIRMRDVPWDQALDVILETRGYGKVRDGNLIRVAPMAVLEAEYERALERMKMSKDLQPLETRLIPVSYATAAEMAPKANDLLSNRGKVSVDARTNVIIARDTAEILNQIEALIRNLDTQTPQVLIEGRIVEATSTYAREIGIQWGGDFSASAPTGNPTGLAFPSSVGVAGGATDNQAPTAGLTPVRGGSPNPNFAVNLPAPVGTGAGGALGISLGSIANNANLNLRLSAMEEEGTLRILSSPKILTLDNRKASIEQGTLIPYSRVSAAGVQTAFKEAKLNLTVTPHVTADGAVLMAINMTRDEPDFNNTGARGDPTILKREAQTELLVNDGHTAVIGGIYTRNHGQSFKKVPFFGDIPILGWFFKSRSTSDRRTEMLIFITPTIVNRAESIGRQS